MSNKASLQLRITGATYSGEAQGDDSASLGGFDSSKQPWSLTPNPRSPWVNLEVTFVSGDNGVGTGVIDAIDEDTLRYTPPGGTSGAEVQVLFGEDAIMLQGDDADDPYIMVKRTSAADFEGSATVQFLNTYNSAVGGADFISSAFESSEKYKGWIFNNTDPSDGVTDLTVWFSATEHTRAADNIAKETPGGGGDIQTIADEDTQPGGRTWVHPTTEGTGLVIGSVAADAKFGLWKEAIVATVPDGSPSDKTHIHYSWTQGGQDYTNVLLGFNRIYEQDLQVVELYVETSIPDPSSDTPKKTVNWTLDAATGLPTYTAPSYTASLTGPATYFARTYIRNGFNLLSPADAGDTFDIDAGGNLLPKRPQASQNAQVIAIAAGAGNITAEYNPRLEATDPDDIPALRANQFLSWATGNGVAPNDGDAPVVTAMNPAGGIGNAILDIDSDAYLDGAPIEVLVRTRRSGDSTDSNNTDTVTATARTTGPNRPRGFLLLEDKAATTQAPGVVPSGTESLDAFGSQLIFDGNTSSFYKDGGVGVGTLIWRIVYDSRDLDRSYLYLPSNFDLIEDDSDFGAWAGGTWQNIERVSGAEWYIATQPESGDAGTRRVKINFSGETAIRAAEFANLPELDIFSFAGPLQNRYNEARFFVYDIANEDWEPYLAIDSDGRFLSRFPFNQSLNQAQIEALDP